MATQVEILILHKQIKQKLASFLKIQEKQVRQITLDLVNFAKVNEHKITPDNMYTYFSSKEDALLCKLIDWNQDKKVIKTFFEKLLDMIPMLIDESGNVFNMTKGS